MLRTRDFPLVRGQTLAVLFTVRDERKNKVDLTGAQLYLWVRADMKVDASVKLASTVTAGHRVGIVLADQTADHRGEFTATFIPADTVDLVALGDSDPYLYDCWVVDSTTAQYPVVATSKIPLYPQTTVVP